MESRVNYAKLSPKPYQHMIGISAYLKECGLEHGLLHLVWLRASQINGCAFCCNMHASDALKEGETQRRVNLVAVWHEAGVFTPRECAALAWTEAVTLMAQTHAPDDVYEQLKAHFTDKEISDLSFAIAQINAWNRLAGALRSPLGN